VSDESVLLLFGCSEKNDMLTLTKRTSRSASGIIFFFISFTKVLLIGLLQETYGFPAAQHVVNVLNPLEGVPGFQAALILSLCAYSSVPGAFPFHQTTVF